MTRVKRGTTSRKKHKKLLLANKGYRMTKRRLVSVAKEAHLHAGQYAYVGRKRKKRDMRSLWIIRISEACKKHSISYNEFIHSLKNQKIMLNRKTLAVLVTEYPSVFDELISKVKK
jgi:large subunit ribosomal protein L20